MERHADNHRLVYLAAIVLTTFLFLIQWKWVEKAQQLERQEMLIKLQKWVPDIALAVNGLGHDYFHGEQIKVEELDLALVDSIMAAFAQRASIETPIHYAIFQDTVNGIFLSNTNVYKNQLLATSARSCLSCIVSFSIVKKMERKAGEDDDAFSKRISEAAEHQYYSPVKNLKEPEGKIIWLAIFTPERSLWQSTSLWILFFSSLALIIFVLLLFNYLIKSFSNFKAATKIKEDFFNSMTHEFKTPLSSIRLASSVLRQNPQAEKANTFFNLIEKESLILENQIDRLLDLSILEHNNLKLEKERIEINDLLQRVKQRVTPLLNKSQAILEIKSNEKIDTLNINRQHLTNTLCNIIENSIKYGGNKVNILLSINPEASGVQFKIKDNGPGIDSIHHAKIFDRFYRANNGNQYKGKGFGIGLSYVKTIVEAHGGSVRINPEVKDGCEFIITIP